MEQTNTKNKIVDLMLSEIERLKNQNQELTNYIGILKKQNDDYWCNFHKMQILFNDMQNAVISAGVKVNWSDVEIG